MKFQSAVVTLALAVASLEASAFAFTTPTSSSVLNNNYVSNRQSRGTTTALSIASSDISEEVRRRKTREVCLL
jgi:hypothetical protein